MKSEPVLSQVLRQIPRLVHGFSTRAGGVSTAFPNSNGDGGDLNLGYSDLDATENVATNRQRWLHAVETDPSTFRHALLRQIHSATVHVIGEQEDATADFTAPGTTPGDGLLTNLPGVLLTVQTADCVPVLIADPVRRAVGAFHAGWRGTLARIVEKGLRTMQERYGTNPKDVLAAVGPSIGPQSYIVSEDLRQQFLAELEDASGLFREAATGGGPRLHLDLWEANRRQLIRSGVPAGNIDVLGMDTATDPARFFSYRAEGGRTGRMMSSIGLRP